MADQVNANINIDIDPSAAISNLRRLESQINKFQKSINAANTTALANQASWSRQLLQSINATGQFTAKIVDVEDSVSRFSRTLEKNKFTLGEYTRLASSQMPGMSKVFRKEFDTIQKVAESRVKSIATQFIALRDTVDGATRAIAITPTGLAKGYNTDIAVAAERQKIFNKLIDDGSTKLLNWGKNTQWAGRQLMVGFSIPLAALGTVAAKTFMEIDKANLSLRRVYGDLSTTTAEIDSNIEAIQKLGKAYTKYGISLAETTDIAARAAATGAQNETLLAATEETLRFATLGQIDYNQALDSTIALQTAFGISNDQLANKIDFLNAVENQTILTIDDMSLAIPRVATVVKGLGGDVEDLAVMMTAMREGGVSAENAANALKSGLASLINPTKRARESLAGMNIDIKAMVNANKGDLMGLITDFANATNALDEFSRQQVFEQVFGKYQYARMSALFTNITKDAGQAARAMELAGMSAQELAAISEKELGAIAETTSVKFQAALETLKVEIAPIGEAFLKGLTPIVELASKLLDAFNNLPDGIKNAVAVTTAVVGGLGPVFLMLAGLVGNGVANIVKGVQFMRKSIARIKGDAAAFNYLSDAENAALLATEKLQGGTAELTGKLLLQERAVESLTAAYSRFATVAGIAGGAMAAVPAGGAVAGSGQRPALVRPTRLASGGTVPGTGNKDTIPALLTPGESVITKQATQQYGPIIDAMNKGRLPGFNKGVTGVQYFGNNSQTGPGGKVKRPKIKVPNPPLMKPGEIHRSHMAGMQSQVLPDSLRSLIDYYYSLPARIDGKPNEQRSYIGNTIISMFETIQQGHVLDIEGKKSGTMAQASNYNVSDSPSKKIKQIKLVMNQMKYLNPRNYEHINIARSGERNSYFLEAGLSDHEAFKSVSNIARGGEALTLRQWEEQVQRAESLLANPDRDKIVREMATAYSAMGKPTSPEGILQGAQDLLKENYSLIKRHGKLNDEMFIQSRIEDMLSSSHLSGTKSIDPAGRKFVEKKARTIMAELRDNGLLNDFISKKISTEQFIGLVSARMFPEKMTYKKGRSQRHRGGKTWFSSFLLSTNPRSREGRTLFRDAVGGQSRLTTIPQTGRNRRSILPFLGIDWMNSGGQIAGYNNGGLIQYFSNNPDPVSQTKALTGKQKFLRRLLESWVGKPVSMDERAVTNVLRTMPGGAEGERYSAGPLYRGFRNRPGDLLPPKVEELIKTAKYGLTEEARQAAARELVGMEFATEPRSWTTDYDVSTRFGPHTMELSQMEGGQFGLDVNKHMPEGNFFAGEKEFVPLEESGRRLILRISSVDLNDPSGVPISSGFSGSIPEGARLGIKVERVTDLSNTRRKKMERELDERIIARRGSLLGRKSKEAKAERRQEIVDYTGAKAKIRDEIFQWMQDIESGQRRYNSWSDWWTESHEAIAHQLFGQENFREFQRAIDRDEWPERMPNVAGSTRKQTLEIVRKIREKGMQGANLGGLIQRFADGGDVAAFMNNPIFQSDKRRYVPGVGNTDTVPAMLTPGEFVINKKATAQNLPLLKAINNGKSVGMNKGGILHFQDGGEMPGVMGHFTRPQDVTSREELRRIVEEAIGGRTERVGEWKSILESINDENQQVMAKLYTNAVSDIPEIANQERMTGTEYSKMLADEARRTKFMKPFVEQLARQLNTTVEDLENNPRFRSAIQKIATQVGTSLETMGDRFVPDKAFNDAFNAAIDANLENFTQEEQAAIQTTRTRKTRAQFYVGGRKVGGRKPIAENPYTLGGVSQPWNPEEFLTPEGNEQRRIDDEIRELRRQQSAARRGATDAAKESLITSNEEIRVSKRKRKRLAYEERVNRAMEKRMAQVGAAPEPLGLFPLPLERKIYEQKMQRHQEKIDQLRKDAEEEVQRDMQRSREQRRREELRQQGRETAIRIAQQRKALEDAGVSREEATRQAREIIMTPTIPEIPQTEDQPDRRQQRQTRRQRIGGAIQRGAGKMFGVGAGMQMASMVPMFAQNEQGQFMGMNAGQLSMGLAVGGSLLEFLPLLSRLPPHVLGAAAAIAVLTGGVIALKKGMDNNIEAGRVYADSLTTSAKELGSVAEIFGNTTLAARRLAKERKKFTGLTTEQQQLGAEFVKTEPGMAMVESARVSLEKDAQSFARNLGTRLSQMIVSGAVDPKSAKAIAIGITDALGRQDLTAQVTAQIDRVLGLNGEDITNTPMQIIANIKSSIQVDEKALQDEVDRAASQYDSSIFSSDNFLNLGSLYSGEYDALTAANVAYYDTYIENSKAILSSIDDEIMRQQDLIATLNKKIKAEEDAGKKKELIDQKNQELDQKQQLIDERKLVADQRRQQAINILGMGGGPSGSEIHNARKRIEEQYGLTALEEMFRGGDLSLGMFNPAPGNIYGGIGAIAYEQRQNLFGTEQQLNNLEVSMLVDMELGNIDAAALKAVEMMASNDSLTAQTRIIPFALDAYVNKDFETVNNLLKYGSLSEAVRIEIDPVINNMDGKQASDLLNILSLVEESVQVKIGVELGKNPEAIKTFIEDIKELQGAGINVGDLLSKTGVKGIQEAAKALTDISVGLKQFAKEVESLNKITDKNKKVQATADVLSKITGMDISPEKVNQYIQDLVKSSGLTEEQVINLPGTQLISSLSMTIDAEGLRSQATNLLSAARMAGPYDPKTSKALADQAATLFSVANTIEGAAGGGAAAAATPVKKGETETTGGGSGGGGKTDPFKDLKKSIMDRLKMFTDFAALMKKYKSSKDGFMKAVQEATVGGGVAGKLRNLGLDENFVQDILSSGLENAQKVLDKLQKNRRQAKALNLAYIKGAAAEELSGMKADTANTTSQIKAFNKIERFNAANPNQQIPSYVRDAIASSPALSALATNIKIGSKNWNAMVADIKAYTEQAEKLAHLEDPNLAKEETLNLMKRQHELDIRGNKERIKGIQDEISEIDKQIAAINRLNEKDQNRIRGLQREKELRQREIDAIQRTIDIMQRANEMDERRIERLRREDEIRNRISDALSHDLEIMSQQEEKIREEYDKRINALDEVAKVNDHILESQRQQLGLSQALSQGDIYAATAASQEMRQSQAKFAQEQMRTGLQAGMEGAIAGLRTSGGLTREQAEAQIKTIKEQSYQTSLQIRDIEDIIYQRNLDMIPLKDQIYNKTLLQQGTDAAILAIQDLIYDRETSILKLRENQEPLEARLRNEEDILKTLDDQFNSTYDSAMALIEQDRITEALNKGTIALTKNWNNVGKAIVNANLALKKNLEALGSEPKLEDYPNTDEGRTAYKTALDKWKESRKNAIEQRNKAVNAAMSEGEANDASIRAGMFAGGRVKKYPMGGLIPYTDGGKVIGRGAMDSVNAKLTPGEFVIRRAMVDKYGIPMLNALNQGALGMPRYNVAEQSGQVDVSVKSQNTSNIVAPMYNNYSVNVNVSGTNASADEIANRTIMKIKQMQNSQIRSGRGY